MTVGRKDRRIGIYSVSTARGAAGGALPAQTLVANVFAEVIEVSGTERFRAGVTVPTYAARFKIWFRAGLTIKHKILYGGRYYNILGIKELGYREELEITAESSGATS